MRFHLVDRIVEVKPGKSLQAVKNLTLGEDYLADHFPRFPVMPGVLMLHALVEAGAWLLRITDDFRHSVTVLREVRNIKYGNFLEPGKQLTLTIDMVERQGQLATFKGKGECEGQSTVSARLVLASYNLRDRDARLAPTDETLVRHLRSRYELLMTLVATTAAGQARQPL
jgi:3-hydroxyacyl-[acyl-carrier-protein] dehydratase